MSKIDLTDEEIERLRRYMPPTVKKRKLLIDSIVAELNRRNFKQLDETNKDDLAKVMQLISDLHPESNERTIKDYSRVSIRLWRKQRN
jgi:hypothetical protein